MSTPRLRLRFERTGQMRDVVEFRRDGWPICPSCNEDELAAIAAAVKSIDKAVDPREVDLCYRCGPVEVVFHGEPESGDLNLRGAG